MMFPSFPRIFFRMTFNLFFLRIVVLPSDPIFLVILEEKYLKKKELSKYRTLTEVQSECLKNKSPDRALSLLEGSRWCC